MIKIHSHFFSARSKPQYDCQRKGEAFSSSTSSVVKNNNRASRACEPGRKKTEKEIGPKKDSIFLSTRRELFVENGKPPQRSAKKIPMALAKKAHTNRRTNVKDVGGRNSLHQWVIIAVLGSMDVSESKSCRLLPDDDDASSNFRLRPLVKPAGSTGGRASVLAARSAPAASTTTNTASSGSASVLWIVTVTAKSSHNESSHLSRVPSWMPKKASGLSRFLASPSSSLEMMSFPLPSSTVTSGPDIFRYPFTTFVSNSFTESSLIFSLMPTSTRSEQETQFDTGRSSFETPVMRRRRFGAVAGTASRKTLKHTPYQNDVGKTTNFRKWFQSINQSIERTNNPINQSIDRQLDD